jgi:hypothetical protein
MAAELYIIFEDKNWFSANKRVTEKQIISLNTFVDSKNEEFWLKGIESSNNPYFDVRLFLQHANYILLEISFHPPSIELSLKQFLDWLRGETSISIQDEDGESSNW